MTFEVFILFINNAMLCWEKNQNGGFQKNDERVKNEKMDRRLTPPGGVVFYEAKGDLVPQKNAKKRMDVSIESWPHS